MFWNLTSSGDRGEFFGEAASVISIPFSLVELALRCCWLVFLSSLIVMVGDNGGTRIVLVVQSDIFLKAFWEYCSIG